MPSMRQAISAYLCDWGTGERTTCDAPLCTEHATQVGPDRHLCPAHAARRGERQEGLF